MDKYYVYAHIRLDKNQVFYIGKGTMCRGKYYDRAYKPDERNPYWKNIVNKTKWTYIILRHFKTSKEALIYETRCINMFGIIKEGGQLCNVFKDSTTNEEFINGRRKKIHKYSLEGDYICSYDCLTDAAEEVDCRVSHLVQVCKGKCNTCKGFQYSYDKLDKLPKVEFNTWKKSELKDIFQYDLEGNFIQSFKGMKEASLQTNSNYFSISQALHGKNKSAGGFKWSFELMEN